MKIYINKLRNNKSSFWYFVDVIMIVLILLNLFLMGFDLAFTTRFFRAIIFNISKELHDFYYNVIHPDFLFYDLFFVIIFLLEFLIRWGYYIYTKKIDKWYYFPFYFWYDLIGCIPLQAFRFLRLIRIISLIIRLQKKGIIDIKEAWWYKIYIKYYYIFVEEISDRVTVNVISRTQDEIKAGTPITEQIITDVIFPKQEIIAKWIAERVKFASKHIYINKKEGIRDYVAKSVKQAVENNKEITDLEKIPILGKQISKALETSISDITYSVIEKTIEDMSENKSEEIINEVLDMSLKTILHPTNADKFEETVTEIAVESLELVKEQVKIKRRIIKD